MRNRVSLSRVHAAFALLALTALIALAAPNVKEGKFSVPPTPANFWDLSGPAAVVPMPFQVVDPNPSAVQLRFTDPPIEYSSVELGGQSYSTVMMSGEASTVSQGEPNLPRVNKMIMVNRTGQVGVTITGSHYTTVENILVAPKQPYEGEELQSALDDLGYALDPSIYEQDIWYPENLAVLSSPATLRDVRFVALTVSPVQYNPARRELRVYDEIEMVIEDIGGVGDNEITVNPEYISPSFKKLYRTFENFEGSALDELPVLPGKYLIICRDNADNTTQAQRLVDWHRRKGLDASYVTTTTTGTTDISIKNYISNLYTSSNGQLEFVCIFGDPGAGASFQIVSGSGDQWDNYYGTIASVGNPDPVPDIAVGRISVSSVGDLTEVVTKTINYESNPYSADLSWMTHAHCTAHQSSYVMSNPSMKEYVRQIMLQDGMNVGPVQVLTSGITETQVNNIVSSYISLFNHRMTVIGELGSSDLQSLPETGGTQTVGARLPFVYAMTCGTGDFDYAGKDESELWLSPANENSESAPRGAIGCVGLHGSHTNVPCNNLLDAGAMRGLYVLGITETGIINIAGKLELYKNFATFDQGNVNNFCWWANLMGDPGANVWHRHPQTTTVSYPASIQRGTNNLSVTVTNPLAQNVEGALVCLLKGTETFARGYTDANGQINLPIATPTTGSLLLTVTKDTQLPYKATITVVTPTTNLALNTTAIDDDGLNGTIGNNDDVFNPGETIDLNINVINNGSSNLTNVGGTLTSASPGVGIITGFQNYGNISAGANANPADSFRVSVGAVFNGEPITLFLNLTSTQGNFVIRLDFTPVAPDVAYSTFSFGGPGGNLNPGESGSLTVTLLNSGSRLLLGADGILRSLDDRVSVTDSVGVYGNISSGFTGSNAGNPFAIAISGAMFNGHTSAMQLVVYDDNGFRDSTNFDLTIGTMTTTSPSGPDAYGYYAFDNTETQPANAAAVYSWVEISPSLGGPGTSLNLPDTDEDLDTSQVHTLPFTFRMYGQDFTQITICSNGWAALGSYVEINDARNFRMASPIGPPFQLAPYWDDLYTGGTNNVYKYYDAATHSFIIEWRALTQHTNVAEVFEIILYDPINYPSATGDGKIKFQYQTVNLSANADPTQSWPYQDTDYASVGIQNANHSTGIDYYYWNSYGPGAATLAANRAIMFTTDDTGQLNPTLTVGAPNGSESIYLGQSTNITWSSTLVTGDVSIELNRSYTPGPGTWETVMASTPNDGVYSWTLSGAASSTSRIRVRSVSNPSVGDTSNANFALLTPTVSVDYPNGGEVLAPGTEVFIGWSDMGLGAATLELNRDYPAGSWELLSNSTASGFSWTVTGPTTSTCRVRVTGNAYPAASDVSDANFVIGVAPIISHKQKSDQEPGAAQFVATLDEDNLASVTLRVLYRLVGAGTFDSVNFVPSGNPSEFYATIPGLVSGDYEYYLKCIDAEGLQDRLPDSGQLTFEVYPVCTAWTGFDDGSAENYNWVDGTDYEWAVKFSPSSFPFTLCAAEYAVNPTSPTLYKSPAEVKVYLADGPSGMPGTVVWSGQTGTVNAPGGLPSGAAWTPVFFSSLVMGEPFYISVENIEPRDCPLAFGLDTGTNSGNSYYYDFCEGSWFSENFAADNSRPGNRMIRISGYSLQAPQVVIRRSGDDIKLHWVDTGAPYYQVYSAAAEGGPFSTFVGSTSDTVYTHTGIVPTDAMKFYRVQASATP